MQTRVRQRDALGRGRAERVEHELADGVRREVAVGGQLAVRFVARHLLILPVRGDQAAGKRAGKAELAGGRGEAAEQGMDRLPAEHAGDVVLEPVEHRLPVARRLVADVVHEPREAVDAEQRAPLRARQEERGDREVLRLRLRHDLRAGR